MIFFIVLNTIEHHLSLILKYLIKNSLKFVNEQSLLKLKSIKND